MNSSYLLIAAGIAGGLWLGWIVVHLIWRAIGSYRIRRAGPPRLRARRHVIWREPPPLDQLDATAGPGGPDTVPQPPFQFVEEHDSGSHPCVSVRDARGRVWRVKWGDEVRAETFAVRFAWSCGYFADVTHFIAEGTIEGASGLRRASACITDRGAFCDARFQLDDPSVAKWFEEHSWAWNDNPFSGTRELSGLKIVVMLLSNWDTKDRRDVARGSNTAIYECGAEQGREARYLVSDWGGALGRWGSNIVTRGNWDVAGFEEQTPQFVTGLNECVVTFGYTGQRTADIAADIPVAHAAWFHGYAGRLTEEYLVRAMKASGGGDDESARFARALMARVRQLGDALARQTEPAGDRPVARV